MDAAFPAARRQPPGGLAVEAAAVAAVGWWYNHISVFLSRNEIFFAFCFDFIPLFDKEMNFKSEVERKKEKYVRSNTVSASYKLLFKNTEQVECP